MLKLYSQSTQQIKSYPRNDDEPIIGLDADYLVLEQVNTLPPEYNPETQTINSDYIVDTVNLEYRQEWVVTDLPPQPNWDMFNSQMLTDPEFNQVYNTANSIAPVVCASLPAALTQVSNGQLSMFNIVWNQIMQLGNATTEMRVKWGNWATDNNLPINFVSIISG